MRTLLTQSEGSNIAVVTYIVKSNDLTSKGYCNNINIPTAFLSPYMKGQYIAGVLQTAHPNAEISICNTRFVKQANYRENVPVLANM